MTVKIIVKFAAVMAGLLTLLALPAGCSPYSRQAPPARTAPPAHEATRTQSAGQAAADGLERLSAERLAAAGADNTIRLVRLSSPVKPGGSAVLTVQGVPGVSYNAASSYRIGNVLQTATQSHVADANGNVTWTWLISPETVNGTYPITVSGGGRSFTIYYSIIR